MADFVTKLTPETKNEEGMWEVHVEGLVGKNGRGAGILVESPTRIRNEHAVHFEFVATKKRPNTRLSWPTQGW